MPPMITFKGSGPMNLPINKDVSITAIHIYIGLLLPAIRIITFGCQNIDRVFVTDRVMLISIGFI